MKVQLLTISLFAIYYLLVSCTQDDPQLDISRGGIPISITVTIPEQEEVLSRAFTDKDIKNITVLVFANSDNKFLQRIDVEESELAAVANGITFNIRVTAEHDDCVLHLIANARTPDGQTERIDFSGLGTTRTEAQIIPSLVTKPITGTAANTLIDNISPLIMWGRVNVSYLPHTTKIEGVKLLRSVACVRVMESAADSSNGLGYLIISRMAIHNGNDRGYVAPSAYNTVVTNTPSMGNPYNTNSCDYNRAWSDGMEPVAYLYERNATSSDYTSVIIEATYNRQIGYYKVALVQNDTPINVVRNHRYTITILSVNGYGYSTVEMAASSAPSNAMKISITDDNEEFPFISADSQHWMGISCNEFHLLGERPGTNLITGVELCTVYSSRGITPVIDNIDGQLTVDVQRVGANKFKLIGAINISLLSIGAISIRCDNLKLDLNIRFSKWFYIPYLQQDNDSYTFNGREIPTYWKVWIPNPETNNYIHLHPSGASPGLLTNNTGSGMVTELTSKYANNVYVHINKGVNRLDEYWISGSNNNMITVRKTVIAQ